ncbi:urease accessory protein UreD [Castellaniella sp.]|uniref:urease accessory protein UreD n=1 Tax=Castellaniella sp. TaxID=1955812 RepID=UPI00355EA0E3
MSETPVLPGRLGHLDVARELRGYHTQPAQMRAAGPGKIGQLRLGFSLRNGRSILHDLYRVAPLLVQQALYWDEAMPELPICSIISVGGGILQGDRYTIDITVQEGACAQVNSQGYNRIHQMDANYASQHQTIRLDAGAYLEYLPDFTIPYRDSRYINHTDIIIDPSATLLYGEMFMTGRKYHHASERFGFDTLSLLTIAQRPDGQRLFHDKILIEKSNELLDFAAVMRGYDAFASVMCLTPPDVAERIVARCEVQAGGGQAGGSQTGNLRTGNGQAGDGRAGSGQAGSGQAGGDRVRAWSGVSALPHEAGLILRAVGVESYDVRAEVRRFWQIVREEARGRTLPDEFLWR